MVDPEATAAILERALAYPYAAPAGPYLYRDGEAFELPDGLDLTDRTPLLAYGANAAPEALARKLAPLSGVELPVEPTELEGFDIVYSAHVSPYGAIPATPIERPGTVAPVFVLHPTAEQRALLTASEPNYDLVEVDGRAAYRSKHGCLLIEDSPVALAAIRSRGRTLPELDEPAILDRVRALLEPHLSLEEFIHTSIARGGGSFPPFEPL
jgi:hypothetical protein